MIKITQKDYFEQIEKNVDLYPKCKLKELKCLKNNKILKENFSPIESKQQIKSLYNIIKNNRIIYNRVSTYAIESMMLEILCRGTDYKFFETVRNRLKQPFKDDDEIYLFIKKLLKKRQGNFKKGIFPANYLCKNNELLAETMAYHFRKFINDVTTYLDVGAGTGKKTVEFAKELGLNLKNVHAIDFEYFDDKKYKRVKDIEFSNNPDEVYPYKDKSFDLVTAFMVLHHINDLDFTLRQINRILKIGGYFYIKEHDNCSSVETMLHDIEHCVYEIVYKPQPNFDFRFENYATYYNWLEWDIITERYGFEYKKSGDINYSVYARVTSTNHFYAIYQKVKDI